MILVWLRIACETDETLKEKYSIFHDKGHSLEIDTRLRTVLILLFYMSNKNTLPSLARLAIRIHTMIVSGPDTYSKSNLATFISAEDSWPDSPLGDEELLGLSMAGSSTAAFIRIINTPTVNTNAAGFMKAILTFMSSRDKTIFA